MATGPTVTTSPNREFLLRLQTLLINGGAEVLRNMFDQRLHDQPLSDVLSREKETISRLRVQNTIKKRQYYLLYPGNGLEPTIQNFDITLIVCLLVNLSSLGLNRKYTWDVPPEPMDMSVEADVCRLIGFQNEISHISDTTGFSQESFQQQWHDIKTVLLRLNSSLPNPYANFDEVLEQLKYSPVDAATERRIELTCKQWRSMEHDLGMRHIEADVDEMKDDGDLKKADSEHRPSMRQRFLGRLFHSLPFGQTKLYKDVQGDLISFYRHRHNRISISPSLKEDLMPGDPPLLRFSMMPDVLTVKVIRSRDGNFEEKTPVKNLRDLFYEDDKVCCSIYLTADAGLGKTAFSKRLALAWCQAKKPVKTESSYFSNDEITCMGGFSFLFLVSLQDNTNECDMDMIIYKQIWTQLHNEYYYDELRTVLNKETCLVILDGLDEWKHPLNACTRESNIPHQRVRNNLAVMTTARPWTFSELCLHTDQIDKKLEIKGLSKASVKKLERSVISYLYEDEDENQIDEFVKEFDMTVQKNHMFDLTAIPLFLMYLLCSWYYKLSTGNSRADLFSGYIEYLLSRTSKQELAQTQKDKTVPENIPPCFYGRTLCKQFYSLLTSLGEVALHTLFSENNGSALIFNGSIAERYLSKDAITFSLRAGIITQRRVQADTLLMQRILMSFAHKTIQDFLAAVYINSAPDQSSVKEILLSKCECVRDVLDMSEILMFIFGINSKSFFSGELMKIINEDKMTQKYRSSLQDDVFSHPLEDLQDMFISCCKEIPRENEASFGLQDVFIDDRCSQEEYRDSLKQLTTGNNQNIRSVCIINMLYVLVTPYNTARTVIDYFSLNNLENIEKIHYIGKYSDDVILPLLNSSVKSLYLSCDSYWSRFLSDKLTSLQRLEAISISNFNMSHNELSLLLEFISQRDCLREIELVGISCSDHWKSCAGLGVYFSRHLSLSKLRLKLLNLSQVLINMSSLEDLWLDISNRELSLRFLNSADSKLNTFSCGSLNSPYAIDEVLRTLRHVRNVGIAGIDLGTRMLSLPPDFVNIEHLKLWWVTMEPAAFWELVASALKLEQTVTIDICRCSISPREQFETIKRKIKRSQHVRVLQDDNYWDRFEFETIKDGH